MSQSNSTPNFYLEGQHRDQQAKIQGKQEHQEVSQDDMSAGALVKALQKNQSYQRVIRKHLKSLDNADEQNREKIRSVNQALYQNCLSNDADKDSSAYYLLARPKPRVIMSCPWFVDKDGNVPPENPDSAHFGTIATMSPLYVPEVSLAWNAESKRSLIGAVRYSKEKYFIRKELRNKVRENPTDAAQIRRLAQSCELEDSFFDSEDEGDETVFESINAEMRETHDAGWVMALASDNSRMEYILGNYKTDEDVKNKLQFITPLPLTGIQGRGDAVFSSRQMNPFTTQQSSALYTCSDVLIPESILYKAEQRINWDWVATKCVRSGKTAVQCAQAWKNAFGIIEAKYSFEDTRKIEAHTTDHQVTVSTLPHTNWVKLGLELKPERAPLVLYRNYLHMNLSKKNELDPEKTISQSRIYGNDMTYLARLQRCSTQHITTILSRQVENKLGTWTQEENIRLCLAVKAYSRKYGDGKLTVGWAQVSKHIPYRNEVACRTRYMEIIGKGKSMSDFTEEEDQVLVSFIQKDQEYNFTALQKILPLYSVAQIKERWLQVASIEDRNQYYIAQENKGTPQQQIAETRQQTTTRRYGQYAKSRGDFKILQPHKDTHEIKELVEQGVPSTQPHEE